MRKIEDMLRSAEAEIDAMGAPAFIDRLYSGRPTPEFTRLKEHWTLGSFAARYNNYYSPRLVWASCNPSKTKKADFSVYGEDRSFLCDIETTSLFPKPTTKDPNGYEDFSPWPVWRDPQDPNVLHVDIDQPRKSQSYATLKQVIKKHLRDQYSPYWLVIWDNEHGVSKPNLDGLTKLIQEVLHAEAAGGRLPASLQQVWIFDENAPGPVLVFPM